MRGRQAVKTRLYNAIMRKIAEDPYYLFKLAAPGDIMKPQPAAVKSPLGLVDARSPRAGGLNTIDYTGLQSLTIPMGF